MLQLTYNEIYSAFYAKVEAYDLAGMVEQQAYDMMAEWLHSVVSNPRFVKLISEFKMDDEIRLIQFSLNRQSGIDEIDRGYIRDVIATGVALRWVEPKYYSALNTSQVFGSSEIRYYSQANHITALKEMRDDLEARFTKLIRDYGVYHNDYLGT